MNYEQLPRSIADAQLSLFLSLYYRYDKHTNIPEYGRNLVDFIGNYQVRYHPIAIAENQV